MSKNLSSKTRHKIFTDMCKDRQRKSQATCSNGIPVIIQFKATVCNALWYQLSSIPTSKGLNSCIIRCTFFWFEYNFSQLSVACFYCFLFFILVKMIFRLSTASMEFIGLSRNKCSVIIALHMWLSLIIRNCRYHLCNIFWQDIQGPRLPLKCYWLNFDRKTIRVLLNPHKYRHRSPNIKTIWPNLVTFTYSEIQ